MKKTRPLSFAQHWRVTSRHPGGRWEPVYLATAHTLGNYVRLVWDLFHGPGQPGAKLYHWESQHSIRIDADRAPHLVQANGEVIGHTPVEIQMVPKAIHVIMPKPAEG